MAETPKVLGQSVPIAATLTDLYTVPASTNVVCSTIVACNRAGTASTFRVSLAPAGAADATSQYLYYDVNLPANDTFSSTIGVTLAATDKIRVYSSSANLTFTALGIEVT